MGSTTHRDNIDPQAGLTFGFMRRDLVTAALVEQSIALQEQAGTSYAAVFLDYKGVPVDIALRVLLRPNERRKMDLSAGAGA
ncbi:MAG: hypothetical protein H7327_15555 [Herminiimonas sp.]|nr:hypothetical protein [Herminiimonas sp.]